MLFATQDNGALASVNLLKNDIGVEQAQALVKIKEAKPSLKTLCGLTMEETELDFSGQNLNAGDAVLLASDINANGALADLNLANNSLKLAGCKAICAALRTNTTITSLNMASNGFQTKSAQEIASIACFAPCSSWLMAS